MDDLLPRKGELRRTSMANASLLADVFPMSALKGRAIISFFMRISTYLNKVPLYLQVDQKDADRLDFCLKMAKQIGWRIIIVPNMSVLATNTILYIKAADEENPEAGNLMPLDVPDTTVILNLELPYDPEPKADYDSAQVISDPASRIRQLIQKKPAADDPYGFYDKNYMVDVQRLGIVGLRFLMTYNEMPSPLLPNQWMN